MLSPEQIDFYHENGYLAVADVYTAAEMAETRAVVEELVERSRDVTDHTDLYDLEPGHSPEQPRVRRLKAPIASHPQFETLGRSEKLLDIVACLIGPEIRLHGNKLN